MELRAEVRKGADRRGGRHGRKAGASSFKAKSTCVGTKRRASTTSFSSRTTSLPWSSSSGVSPIHAAYVLANSTDSPLAAARSAARRSKQSPVSMKLPIWCANCRTRVKREGDCRQSRSAFANRAKPKAHRDLAGYSECRRLHFSDADGNAIRRRIRVRKNGSIFHRSTFVGLQIF